MSSTSLGISIINNSTNNEASNIQFFEKFKKVELIHFQKHYFLVEEARPFYQIWKLLLYS